MRAPSISTGQKLLRFIPACRGSLCPLEMQPCITIIQRTPFREAFAIRCNTLPAAWVSPPLQHAQARSKPGTEGHRGGNPSQRDNPSARQIVNHLSAAMPLGSIPFSDRTVALTGRIRLSRMAAHPVVAIWAEVQDFVAAVWVQGGNLMAAHPALAV